MTKILKKFTLAIVTVCLIITGVFAAACNPEAIEPEDPAKDGYTITVLYPDGTPVKASDTGNSRRPVRVKLTDDDGNNVIPNYDSQNMGILNDYGTTTLNYKVPGEFNIAFIWLPEGYDAPEVKTSTDKSKYTITLINKTCSYEVSVKLPDGSAAAGLGVKLSDGTTTVAEGITNEHGKYYTHDINAGEYAVIVSAPEGKNYNHKPLTTKRSGAPVEVKLFETTVITTDEEDRMTPTDLDNWISKINGFDIKYIDESADNYLFSADVYGKEETFFILHAEKTGEYRITLKYDEDDNGNPVIVKDDSYGNYIVKFYVNGSFGQENENMRLEGNGNGGIRSQILSMTAGDDFIFSVSSIDGREHYSVDFVMAYANMPSTTPASGDETYTLTYADIDEAILSFTPDKSGKYKITSLSDENDPKIIVYSAGTNSPIYNEDGTPMGDDNSGDGNNFSYTENVQQQHIGITYYYHIFINKTATTRLDVKIERIGNADEDPEVVTDIAKVEATLVKQSKQQGTWTPLAQENKVVEKNGEYFVTVNGIEYKVYAAITKNLGGAEYSFATIESMGPEDVRPGDNGSSSSDGKKNDYLTVYELNSSTQRYNYTDFIKTYSEYCDEADGVYPLNGELKLFIERYMANHWADIVDEPDAKNPPSNMLALACGYFA